jgi:phosphatidylinositol-3-phosphatase
VRRDADGAHAQQRSAPGRVGAAAIVGERHRQCAECDAPLAGDQHYCLSCGARAGARSPQLEGLLRRLGVHSAGRAHGEGAISQGESDAAASAEPPAAAATPPGLRLPPRPVSALLVAVFLGFGVLLGDVARSPVADTLASANLPRKIVLPATAATAPSTEAPAVQEEAEPPQAQAEPTPEAAQPAAPAGSGSGSRTGANGTHAGGGAGSKAVSGGGSGSSQPAAPAPATRLPPIKHVFVIMLSDEPYASALGPSSTAPYLARTLERKGELLVRYYAVAHEQLANEVALISGQGPTAETAANCPVYTEIAPTGTGADEQVLGNGCVYPPTTQTLAGQLSARRLSWRAYVQGIDEPGAPAGACAHPTLGAADPTADQTAGTGPYATFRNPFVYFASVIDSPQCEADDVGLASLKGDLSLPSRTPSLAYIVPDRCHDGNPTPCAAGAPAGMAQANAFLEQVVPEILASKAYKESGLLAITVDEAPSSGTFADSSSCCGQPLFPNAPSTTPAGAPRGGGAVGALLLSPYVKAGATSQQAFNDFSLLRTIEDLFGLSHLGYAALGQVKSFEPAMFTAGKR